MSFKVVCISTVRPEDGARVMYIQEGKVYEVIRIVPHPIDGRDCYELQGLLPWNFSSDLFQKLDDDFGSQIAEKIEKELNTKKLVKHE